MISKHKILYDKNISILNILKLKLTY